MATCRDVYRKNNSLTSPAKEEMELIALSRGVHFWLINELCKGVANRFPAGNREFKSIANGCADAG